jgi:hypothetical protein
MFVQGKLLAWRMEFLNDPERTDLLRAKSVAEWFHFQRVWAKFSFRRGYAEFARNVQRRESFTTLEFAAG